MGHMNFWELKDINDVMIIDQQAIWGKSFVDQFESNQTEGWDIDEPTMA